MWVLSQIEPYRPEDRDTIDDIIVKYKAHPSIKRIIENVDNQIKFTFSDVSSHEIQDEILKLNPKTANGIPTKILIGSNEITSSYLSEIDNAFRNHHDFPMALKLSDVIPVHETDEKNIMKNF